jgi:hypothetical protein
MRVAFAVIICTFLLAPDAAARSRVVRARPSIQRVFLVVLENQDADAVLSRPFVQRLVAGGGLLANYHCITHPSQPNYIALAAGSTWGVKDDSAVVLDVPHLGDLFDARAISWKVYAERYPGGCFLGTSAANQLYVRRHVPFLEFANMQKNGARCAAHVVNATLLDADIAAGSLPAFSMYIPDQDHNGHETDVDTADAWMAARFGPLLNDPRFMNGTLFILTYDESGNSSSTRVATVLYGAGVKRGSSSARLYDHYDLLRTIEELLHVPTLGKEDLKQGERITDVFQ